MSTSNMCSTQTLGLFKCVIACVCAITARFRVARASILCADELKMNIMIYDILHLSLASPHISTTVI